MENRNDFTKNVAVIDVGTIKSKLIICSYDAAFRSKILFQTIKRIEIGGSPARANGVSDTTIDAIARTLNFFCEKMTEFNVSKFRAISTEGIRSARNADTVLAKIENETNIRLEILDYNDEATYFFLSVAKDFQGQVIAVADIGGGSTQVVLGTGGQVLEIYHFKTGAYFLHDEFSKYQSISERQRRASTYIKGQLAPLSRTRIRPTLLVFGTSKVIDFMQAMQLALETWDSHGDHPFHISVERLTPLYRKIATSSSEEKAKMYPTDPDYMSAADMALLNIFQISAYLKTSIIVPSNNSVSNGILNALAREV